MLILLAPSVFQAAGGLTLMSIANYALADRHRLIVLDETHVDYIEWLAAQSPLSRDEWNFISEQGYEREALEPARYQVRVENRPLSDWTATPPALSIQEANQILGLPFHVVLEDAVSDKSFLLKAASPEQRHLLEQKEARGEISFENGGGISSMPRRVHAAVAEGKAYHARRWFMFDSDALLPGQPSAQSEILRAACQEAGIEHHQLRRRAIENYIPRPALESWTYGNGKASRQAREPVMRTFSKLAEAQRHHFNLKYGLAGDSKRKDGPAEGLFDDRDHVDISNLQNGFGDDVATLFSTDIIDEKMLERDGSLTEMRPVINALIAQMR